MKSSGVRQNIVETASHLFYQNGYSLTGINEIIKEAGIAKATLYHHFKSKEEICIAYLQYKNETLLHDINVFIAKRRKGKNQLLALFDFLKTFFQDNDFNGCWCINTVSEIPKDNQKIRAEIQTQKAQFIQLIEELCQRNLTQNTKAKNKLLAKQIYLLYEGAISESHLHQDSWPIDAARGMCKQLLV